MFPEGNAPVQCERKAQSLRITTMPRPAARFTNRSRHTDRENALARIQAAQRQHKRFMASAILQKGSTKVVKSNFKEDTIQAQRQAKLREEREAQIIGEIIPIPRPAHVAKTTQLSTRPPLTEDVAPVEMNQLPNRQDSMLPYTTPESVTILVEPTTQ